MIRAVLARLQSVDNYCETQAMLCSGKSSSNALKSACCKMEMHCSGMQELLASLEKIRDSDSAEEMLSCLNYTKIL